VQQEAGAGPSLAVAALPGHPAALASWGAADTGLGWQRPRGQRWETMPAADNPSPGLRQGNHLAFQKRRSLLHSQGIFIRFDERAI